jgi:simple sugar transport system substrate-binding protein
MDDTGLSIVSPPPVPRAQALIARAVAISLLSVWWIGWMVSAYDVAIFVPGVVAGSPLCEDLVAGVERVAAENPDVTVKVLEAGFDQSTWEEQMVSLAAIEEYELIVSSNGAMPFVSMQAADAFPDQKFLFVDSIIVGNPQMYSVLYNQVEQAAMLGYLAGLVTTSTMNGATPALKVGFIAGQEYEALNFMIKPGYELGARLADPDIEVDFRVLGNWYDVNKASELANSMIDAGVDAIMTACGAANLGVIEACRSRGKYVLYLDADKYDLAPGTIIGCAALGQRQAVYESVRAALAGELVWGEYRILGVGDGYVEFVDTNPLYESSVPEGIRTEMQILLADLRSDAATWLQAQMEVPEYW